MKTLRTKKIPMRTMFTTAFAAVLFAVMAVSQDAAVMAATSPWTNFKNQMNDFFYTGLGGEGMQGIGIVIAVCGIALAVISFVVHKINPQSRMPGWFTCLIVALLGTMLFAGVKPVLSIVEWIRDTVFGWFGVKNFGSWK